MTDRILGWIGGILCILNIFCLIIGNIIRVVYWLKCFKIKYLCENRNCRFRCFCLKYDARKEILDFKKELLKKWIEENE